MAAPFPIIEAINREIINPIIQLLFAGAFIAFLYGVAEYVYYSTNDAKRSVGRQHIMYGLIGMFIMISAIGLTNFVCRTVGACS